MALRIIATGMMGVLLSFPLFADEPAEPVDAECVVKDQAGIVLPAATQMRAQNFDGMRGVGAASERFMFDVYLKDGEGRFILLDKTSGEKVLVQQSRFTGGETLTVALLKKDSDEAILTLHCVGI